jgi:hypothetical protein
MRGHRAALDRVLGILIDFLITVYFRFLLLMPALTGDDEKGSGGVVGAPRGRREFPISRCRRDNQFDHGAA